MQSADIDGLIDEAYDLIAPYVEKDPTKFCTYDEFETGVQTLKNFCYLRAQSVAGQLDGSIPSTSEGGCVGHYDLRHGQHGKYDGRQGGLWRQAER